MTYATLAQVRAYLYDGNAVAPTASDALLTACLERATAAIDAACGRSWRPSSAARTYRASGGELLWLDRELVSVTSITEDGQPVAATDYELWPLNTATKDAIRKLSGGWSGAVIVTGVWGSGLVPMDIEHACVRLAAWLYKQKDVHVDAPQVAVSADGQVIVPGGLPRDVMELISRHQRLVYSSGY